jgi:hypothetical protein
VNPSYSKSLVYTSRCPVSDKELYSTETKKQRKPRKNWVPAEIHRFETQKIIILKTLKQYIEFSPEAQEAIDKETLFMPLQYGDYCGYMASCPRVLAFANNPGVAGVSGGERTESVAGANAKKLMVEILEEYTTSRTISDANATKIIDINNNYFKQGTAHGFFSPIGVYFCV